MSIPNIRGVQSHSATLEATTGDWTLGLTKTFQREIVADLP